jgi:hypothetical protein
MPTGTFHSKVAGVTKKNANGLSRQNYIRVFCKAGMPLTLIREPNNQYDRNAIGVWITARVLIFFTGRAQIGYLNATIAAELARFLDSGKTVHCKITEITGGTLGKKNLGVNILITKVAKQG